ncbi:dynein assembly factor 4, axonemal-like [Centruroides sculpturatus]|uniref:dynein assembly factor 4, axonemal-like n=1 Tax=Centruroides sculpturatus TaxID=218467 RepID=UPI000C6E570B|nr:dynein assembly factor 4, axonemal-like [Centruroides sculpturatus]
MPIFIKDVSWSETEGNISINVAFNNVNKKNLSILSSSQYLKISHPPFFWEAFLKKAIDIKKCNAFVGDNAISFALVKREKGLWKNLYHENSEDRTHCEKMRKEALQEIEETAKSDKNQKKVEKSERERLAVRLQMELEANDRKRIEKIKENERNTMIKEIEDCKEKSVNLKNKEINSKAKERISKKSSKNTFNKYHLTVRPSTGESLESVAPPRSSATINVTFTPREFPTAARESRKEEEEEWLRKQAEARKCNELEFADLRPEERNPLWLKDKGDDFYSKGDYKSAINTYTLAIKLCPNLASLYSNRAACHLQIQNLHKAIEDTSRALELLTPAVQENSSTRLKCHIRRGTAFCKMEMYAEGLQDYEEALKIDPNNRELLEDAKKIRKTIQGFSG